LDDPLIEWVPADLCDRQAITSLVRGVDAVVHAALQSQQERAFQTAGEWTLRATGCEVKDGELIVKTGNAAATIGTDGGAPRFHLRAEAEISPNGCGFFEFWPKDKKSQLVFLGASNGHIRGAPFKKTPYPADWFLLEVQATEDRITVKVDGVTTSGYPLTDADRKNREGEGSRHLRLSAGGLTEL
jgi:hypothetical protein